MLQVNRVVAALALLCAACTAAAQSAADTIYRNCTIVTMNPAAPSAKAVAVKDGRIVAVGAEAAIEAWKSPRTNVVDLGGKTMLPGFYAAHDHFPGAGTSALFQVDLNSPPVGKMQNIGEIVAALRARAAAAKPGEWITGRGYDDTLLAEKRHPTRADLDRASTDHPIWITHVSGHLGVANSRALEIAKITRWTPDPQSGRIRKDANGEPNGVIEESMGILTRHIPARTPDERQEAIRWAGRHYVSRGVTTTCIAGSSAAGIRDLEQARQSGILPLRVVSMTAGELPQARAAAGKGDDRLRLGAVKLFSDGSIQGYTGYLKLPYFRPPGDDPAYRGYPHHTRAELTRMVVDLDRKGYQVAIHSNGDAAIDDVLYAYAEAARQNPRADARHRIEHCQMAREDQLDEMRRLGISPSFFVGHVYYWGDRHRDIFLGEERARHISPLASAAKRGIRFTLHDDTPVTPVNPLLSVWGAANRLTRDGKLLGPEQRISVIQALRAVTIDAAWQNFEEDRKGSIETGKLADFVILEENPLTVEPVHIRDIRIAATIVGGRQVYP